MKELTLEEQFEHEDMRRLVWKMALPCIAAQLVNMLYNIVDRIYIGHIEGVGTLALAGVGICSTIIILISSFALIVGAGGAPIASIALGKQDTKKARDVLQNGYSLLILFGVCLVVLFYFGMESVLVASGATDVTLPFALDYMRIYLFGTFFVLVMIGLTPFLNVQGLPKKAMAAVLIGAIINIVLDPILIFWLGMGVKGAALASVLSQGVACLYILYQLSNDSMQLCLDLKKFVITKESSQEMLALGVSPFVMGCTEAVIGFVLNGNLAMYGDVYVSALTIMQSAMMFIGVPLSGFGQGCIPIISYNYGHKDEKRVKEAFWIMLKVSFVYNFVLIVVFLLWPHVVAGIFTDDAVLIETVSEVMVYFLAGMSIFGLQRACQNMFVAMNQPKTSLFIALLRKILLLVPLAYILPKFVVPGYLGVYLAESVADGVAAVLCTLIFAIRFPKILKHMKSL